MESAATIKRALSSTGHEVTVEVVQPADLMHRMAEAARPGLDVLIVGGGDGTIRSAASLLKGGTIALGILPLGTINRLARDLGIPLSLKAAADALAHGAIHEIDVAEVNGRIFMCNSLLGLPLTYSEERQRLRGRPVMERIRGYLGVAKRILQTRRKLAIAVDDGNEQRSVRAMTMAVSNNSYAEAPGLWLTRPALDQGHLGLYIARHATALGLAVTALRALFGRWTDDPNLTAIIAHKGVVTTKRPKVRLSNDGEVEEVETPLVYKIHPRALKVLRPRPSATAA